MKTFSIRASVKRGWELFKGHKKTLVVSFVAVSILQGIQNSGGGKMHERYDLLMTLAGILAFVAVTIVQIGWLKLTLMIEEGKDPKWTEIFAHGDLFFKYILGTLLYIAGFVVGLILFILPGIYFTLTYGFVPMLLIDTDLSIGQAFTKSAEMSKGYKWKLLALNLTLLVLIIVGAMILVVGLLVAIPVVMLAYAHVYRSLLKVSNGPVPEAI
jgi:uncharacterized membrane protein